MVLTTALAAQLARALPRVHHFAPRVKQVHTGRHHPKGEFARHAQLGTTKRCQAVPNVTPVAAAPSNIVLKGALTAEQAVHKARTAVLLTAILQTVLVVPVHSVKRVLSAKTVITK